MADSRSCLSGMREQGLVAHLPGDPWPWLTPAHAATVAIALPAIALGAVMLGSDRPWTYAPIITAVVTLGASLALFTVARRATRSLTATGALVVGTPFVAAICCGALGFAWGLHWSPARASSIGFAMALQAFFATLPLGGWQGALAATSASRLERPSHDMRDRLLVAVGSWLAGPATALGLLGLVVGVPWPMLAGWLLATVLAPTLIVVWALTRLRARRRWLAAVLDQRVPGWRVVEGTTATEGLMLLIAPPARLSHRMRVLVKTQPQQDPFREAEQIQPFALVAD